MQTMVFEVVAVMKICSYWKVKRLTPALGVVVAAAVLPEGNATLSVIMGMT